MRVDWGDMPLEITTAVAPFVNRYLDLLPAWCHTLEIRLETDAESDSDVSMTSNYRYRVAQMRVLPNFLLCSDFDREQTIVHEFAHVLGAPLVDYIDAVVALLKKKDPDTADMLRTLQESGEEAATEDISTVLWTLTADRRK